MKISRLDYVNIREIWQQEAADFTTWLADNIDYLNDKLGFNLNVLETEKKVGSFNVDIFCEDEHGNSVIIENQLERTDHSHLGQILTYAVGVDAKTVIWISPEPRREHVEVIEWLNEVTPVDMSWYILKIEAVRIGDFPVAPLFSLIAGPSQEGKETGMVKKDMAERHLKRIQFWEGLLPVLNEKTSLYRNISPSRDNWLAAGSGVSGVNYSIVIRMNSAAIRLAIAKDKSRELNKRIFDYLYDKKDEIEQAIGDEINWRRMDNQISSTIEFDIDCCGLNDESTWEKGYEVIAETLVKWEDTFRPYLNEIRKNYRTFEIIQQ
ncbi:MAG: DUF4268 domain-containing protein [Thermoanaerobacterales bacterium]|nr:DUF4268 domain-containing protein [Thermoanaerobacterales bacterium]